MIITDLTNPTLPHRKRNLFGLLELDTVGTVLYSRIEADGDMNTAPPDMSGSNFYTEVASFINVEEFRQRLQRFTASNNPAESFAFNFLFDDDTIPVRVLLARMQGRVDGDHTKSVLVHIRKSA